MDFFKASPEGRDNRECVRRGFFVIVKLSQKSLAFFKALPRGREETMGDTVYGIMSVLLLLLVLGFLIVFREFGMISE